MLVLSIDGRRVEALAGRSLGAVLHQECNAGFRLTPRAGARRGLFCGMGVCFECVVSVDGRSGVRACITPVIDGMTVETGTR